MQKYKVYESKTFAKHLRILPAQQIKRIKQMENQLAANPYSSKPLGFPYFREKKLREKRVYFLIYEYKKIVLLVAISGKKSQRATISFIKNSLKHFKDYVNKLFMLLF